YHARSHPRNPSDILDGRHSTSYPSSKTFVKSCIHCSRFESFGQMEEKDNHFLTQLKAGLRPPRHPNGWDGPVDGLDADLLQEGVGPRKRPAAEEARVRRIRARMRRLDHQVAAGVDHGLLLLGVAAPQDEDQRPFPLVQQLDDAVGEPLPALAPV